MQDYYRNPSRLLTVDKNGLTYYDVAFEFLKKQEIPIRTLIRSGLFRERLVNDQTTTNGLRLGFLHKSLHTAYRELPEKSLSRK